VGRIDHTYRGKYGPHSVDGFISELGSRQHGVVAAAQLLQLGVPRCTIDHRVAAERLTPIYHGVYAVGHTALGPEGRDLAAVLSCGPEAVLSHRAAERRWGFRRISCPPEVTAPRSRTGAKGFAVHRTRCLPPEDRAKVDGIPVTSVARTLVDLADVLTERQLAKAVHEAEVLRLFDLRALERAQARVPGRKGRHRLARVLASYRDEPPFTRNDAERAFLELCQKLSLPQPIVNAPLHGYEVDFFWPGKDLAVELDGAEVHLTRKAFEEDRRRDRALAIKGIQVLRVTWRDLNAGARDLAAILRR
jgi:very-short-patch-repair endonuclease